jgi:hypothetical protein
MGKFRQTYSFAQFVMWFSDRTGQDDVARYKNIRVQGNGPVYV